MSSGASVRTRDVLHARSRTAEPSRVNAALQRAEPTGAAP